MGIETDAATAHVVPLVDTFQARMRAALLELSAGTRLDEIRGVPGLEAAIAAPRARGAS
jgi:hypothetical protein